MKIPQLQTYVTKSGVELLYVGTPDYKMLDELADGPGDLWHSGPDQGFRDAFMEIAYQATVFLWYVRDFDGLDQSVSWRINPAHFAVRKSAWEHFGGFRQEFKSSDAAALHFGYNALLSGAVILFVKNLFPPEKRLPEITAADRYRFYFLSFKKQHAVYMLYRRFWRPVDWIAFYKARRVKQKLFPLMPVKPVHDAVDGSPTVSYIIPTMSRQDYTLQLLDDLKNQTWLPQQVVVVDATPPDKRDETLYNPSVYPFKLDVIWQTSKGSCRGRNEGINRCTSDYIIFGDDDLRLPPEFIANHLRFVQTHNLIGGTGLDIMADNPKQNLQDLAEKEKSYGRNRWRSGVSQYMSNSNAIVRRDWVETIGGNDVNFDGGYGEDNDFGFSLIKKGGLLLHNPHALLLHLKPPAGGYRVWGTQSKVTGKKRKKQPWELDAPVKWIRPAPSPTLIYSYLKHFGEDLTREYRRKYFFTYLFKGSISGLPMRLLRVPKKQLQFNRALFYARKLISLGPRLK